MTDILLFAGALVLLGLTHFGAYLIGRVMNDEALLRELRAAKTELTRLTDRDKKGRYTKAKP